MFINYIQHVCKHTCNITQVSLIATVLYFTKVQVLLA